MLFTLHHVQEELWHKTKQNNEQLHCSLTRFLNFIAAQLQTAMLPPPHIKDAAHSASLLLWSSRWLSAATRKTRVLKFFILTWSWIINVQRSQRLHSHIIWFMAHLAGSCSIAAILHYININPTIIRTKSEGWFITLLYCSILWLTSVHIILHLFFFWLLMFQSMMIQLQGMLH